MPTVPRPVTHARFPRWFNSATTRRINAERSTKASLPNWINTIISPPLGDFVPRSGPAQFSHEPPVLGGSKPHCAFLTHRLCHEFCWIWAPIDPFSPWWAGEKPKIAGVSDWRHESFPFLAADLPACDLYRRSIAAVHKSKRNKPKGPTL